MSSRCRSDTDVFCVSYYLKTAIVGGNNNERILNKEEIECMMKYEEESN